MKHKENPILLVFPGLGKTYFAKEVPGVADCDYGYYRAAMKTSNKDYLNAFCQICMNIYANEGFITLTNDPCLIPWLKQTGHPLAVILPNEEADMAPRILQREHDNPTNMEFAVQYSKHWKEWVKDWERKATKYSIPIVYVKYLFEDWTYIRQQLRKQNIYI